MAVRRVTVEDVARHAGVSTATVSRAINGSDLVSKATKARVEAAVAELGFRPTPAAQNLRQQRTRNIALVVPSIRNPFFPELVANVHPEIAARGYSLLLIDTDEPEREATRVARSRLVDGVLLVGSIARDHAEPAANSLNIPIVAFDRAPHALPTTVVQCDNAGGARAVVDHLIDLGHRRIVHITGPAGLGVADDRARGYQEALAASEIAFDPALVRPGDFSEDAGYAAALDLVASGTPFTALFAANDLMAIGAIAALKSRGFDVPQDVAVAGFDGIHLARYVNPTLTTYVQPIDVIAHRAVGLLLDAVESGDTASLHGPGGGQRTLQFAGEVIVRQSSGRSVR